ncbi:hypothetical protein GUITHDRAFT_163251 [Guillardia theta CCMP2712]|uniref:Mini-chromosome maintenance complex-binding protein n=1 Tax=Guillardia theta (strain CCMP2712) TaxID=905079 RepID=L1JB65_GUITC|nr:hypothetical protein GUITHDRAFT_163251 [Guillardia theta CCMP2712]EKX45354.1 hypothetical protein GUITHDRAFT_163251 [Guillardia theta CCMP2712]|eukprot:XP_005832334.1 hypothetical protein GUITHDRAFT_163251 [Guillardia theta CCMP2712]
MPVPIATPTIEEIREPSKVIGRILTESPSSDVKAQLVKEHFSSSLRDHWHEIPLLNSVDQVEQIRPGTLVRFRCMVQNTYNPEWYVGEYELVNKATGERKRRFSLYADSVESEEGCDVDMSSASSATLERIPLHCISIPFESSWVGEEHEAREEPMTSTEQRSKRSLEEEDVEMADVSGMEEQENKRSCSKSQSEGMNDGEKGAKISDGSFCHSHMNDRIDSKQAAIVKVYDADARESVKVNEIYEVVRHAPSGCLGVYRKRSAGLPALPQLTLRPSQLVNILSNLTHGDEVAAEYLLCHLISRIYHRLHGVPVGKLSLALSGLQPGSAEVSSSSSELLETLRKLLPMVADIKLSIKELCGKSMTSKKDYETDMLHMGKLQVEFPTDVPALVLSQGRSLLRTDIALKLEHKQRTQPMQLSDELLARLRAYLQLARSLDVKMSDDFCKIAEEKFVSARQEQQGVTQETFGLWLTLSRLLAASYGEEEVTSERWEQALQLEGTRKQRSSC